MSQPQAEQLALDGLAPRRRRPSRKREPQQAQSQPIARVVLDVQAPHLGQTFDYLVASKDSDTAQAGALVRVRFGGQRVNGIIWERAQSSDLPSSSLKYIERVLVPQELISASMRRDISAIAQAYGGTRANILRLALPPRVARVDREQAAVQAVPAASNPAWQRAGQAIAEQMEAELQQDYQHIESLSQAFSSDAFTSVCIDALPGLEERERLLAWSVVQSLLNARSAVVVLPDARHMASLARALTALGLRPFAPDPDPDHEGGWAGDFVLLGSSLPPAERYRSYRALASGQVSCVLGLRAAMYAPVEGPALFAILDDAAYQNADGMTPYANARGVLRLRAKLHQGIFVSLGHARSARSQWECSPDAQEVSSGVTGPAQSVVPAAPALSDRLPWVRWFNRQELARLADPAIGARVPHVAVSVLNQALQSGPVLLLIPQDGVEQTLSCAHCHRQARCPKCTGPLRLGAPGHAPRCAWCGSAAVGWACPSCSCEQMRLVRVGAAGTAQELRLLFRGVPITISTPQQPRGIVEQIDARPRLVIATAGAEPRVMAPGKDLEQTAAYQAVAILDAWTSLYALGVDARLDLLTAWMRTVALCKPRAQGGQALILGESDPSLVQALMTWHPDLLAAAELADRAQTGLPPTVALASLWGNRQAVSWAIGQLGANLDGDMGLLEVAGEQMPSLMGPVPIAPQSNLAVKPLEGTGDRVRALVRVPVAQRDELALRLHRIISTYMASRGRSELRFCMDPKDLT